MGEFGRRRTIVGAAGALGLLVAALGAGTGAEAQPPPAAAEQYIVAGPADAGDRSAVAATGAAIDEVSPHGVMVSATPGEAEAIDRLGYQVDPVPASATPQVLPPNYEGYHDFAELTALVDKTVADHPAIARKVVVGKSYEGRDIVAVRISDNVAADEGEPEVLFTHGQHAREILTVEMAVYLIDLYTDGYGADAQVTRQVDNRVIWILPNVNPDGSEHDKNPAGWQFWRKNRQPNPGSTAIGTDMNRNWGWQWGCCNGSSADPASDAFRGSGPESAPEVKVLADFVRSRVIGGRQRIEAHIDWHAFSELMLYPYGYTASDTAPGLNAMDRSMFAALGQTMADSNGYKPMQASDLYVADGSIIDWMWGSQRIASFGFEMYPTQSMDPMGFYPQQALIEAQTSRNRDAVLAFVDYADCVYRVVGAACDGSGTVYADDFETETGWTADPGGRDTATSGQWERGVPQRTGGLWTTLQQGTTTSGTNDLVTGATSSWLSPGWNDVDGGVTSIRSPAITLPATGRLTLSAQWYLAHLNNASTVDFFRISIVAGTTTTKVFEQLGAASNRAGAWAATPGIDLTPYAGQSIRILVETADAGPVSLIEAGVDDVKIVQAT